MTDSKTARNLIYIDGVPTIQKVRNTVQDLQCIHDGCENHPHKWESDYCWKHLPWGVKLISTLKRIAGVV